MFFEGSSLLQSASRVGLDYQHKLKSLIDAQDFSRAEALDRLVRSFVEEFRDAPGHRHASKQEHDDEMLRTPRSIDRRRHAPA